MSHPEDILSTSLQTLYDYAPITHSSGGDKFTYKNTSAASPTTVTLRTPDPKAVNWSLHASSIWVSSIYAVDHLEDLQLDRLAWDGSPEGGPRLLELGAAAGLPGIVIAQAYPSLEVTVSDYPDENLISALSDNVIANATSKQCRVVPYAWGSEPSVFAPHAPFDVILACDTLWNPDLHTLFIKTLCDLLKKTDDARIRLIAGLHTGRFTLQAFMLAVQAAGLHIRSAIEKEVIGSQKREWNAERDDSEHERRRWIVWMTLSWPIKKANK
ncbi:hypothetical protein FIBSPDRAFT_911423 [Athelia psychrophila]|uniref:Uncharacterized protein n=1 Tax=Athelia psychrophila TaxID=1759441 RepID=A0A166HYV6_9AGAM|nr:hypothetical protein FIBSPDRAFT_911423 [Fibularhizoctonia sp. CBS 109695]